MMRIPANAWIFTSKQRHRPASSSLLPYHSSHLAADHHEHHEHSDEEGDNKHHDHDFDAHGCCQDNNDSHWDHDDVKMTMGMKSFDSRHTENTHILTRLSGWTNPRTTGIPINGQ